MRIITDIESLPDIHGGALVPTMGALHEGHLALVRRAVETDHRPVVVSIFVNPTQFGPNEDYERYPRSFDDDVAKAEQSGAEIVFAPDVKTMYPPDEVVPVPPLPAVATEPGLEDAHRPGHFEGVCQVVARLFDLVKPRAAVFGEKDYQQLLVIRALVEQEGDRWPNLEIIPHETIREPDGLAMSSRNAYLSDEEREQALGISRALRIAQTADSPAVAKTAMRGTLLSHRLEIDYAVVRDAQTLMPIDDLGRPARTLIAARLGDVRLIDNASLPQSES